MARFEPKPFGKYFLTDRIAVGGMAEIYKAKTFGVDGFEKILAIKKILSHYSADKEFITMLTDEAKLVVNLSHANIVQVYDLGRVGDDYFISMEFIDGINLRDLLDRAGELGEKIPPDIIVYIASEVCKGLDHAHNKRDDQGRPLQIVHRDISPHNILVSYDGTVKIVDFGIAKAAMNLSETHVGILKGKVTYMSPEQAFGKPLDGRTDIFSLGVVLYELFTGRRLFTGENQMQILKQIRNKKITVENLNKAIPAFVRPVLARALAYSVKDRYASAADMQIELMRILYTQFSDFSPRKLVDLLQRWFRQKIQNQKEHEKEGRPHEQILVTGEARQVNLVHRDKARGTAEMLPETVKPEDGLTPDHLEHGPPEPTELTEKSDVTEPGDWARRGRHRPGRRVVTAVLVVAVLLVAVLGLLWHFGLLATGEETITGGIVVPDEKIIESGVDKPRWDKPVMTERIEDLIPQAGGMDGARLGLDFDVPVPPMTAGAVGHLPIPESEKTVIKSSVKKIPVRKTTGAAPQTTTKSKDKFSTVTHPTSRNVAKFGKLRIDSRPRGASVRVNGVNRGITPIVLGDLKKNQGLTITVSKKGYRTYQRSITLVKDWTEINAQLNQL